MMTPRRVNCNLIFDGEALWQAIEEDLRDDPRLTVAEIAASLGVTRAYLYKLRAFTDGSGEPGGRVSECIRRRYPAAHVWRERDETPQDAPVTGDAVSTPALAPEIAAGGAVAENGGAVMASDAGEEK